MAAQVGENAAGNRNLMRGLTLPFIQLLLTTPVASLVYHGVKEVLFYEGQG